MLSYPDQPIYLRVGLGTRTENTQDSNVVLIITTGYLVEVRLDYSVPVCCQEMPMFGHFEEVCPR